MLYRHETDIPTWLPDVVKARLELGWKLSNNIHSHQCLSKIVHAGTSRIPSTLGFGLLSQEPGRMPAMAALMVFAIITLVDVPGVVPRLSSTALSVMR